MKNILFDETDKYSVIEYAKNLINQTLRLKCTNIEESKNSSNKGNFGQFLEKYYFLYKPNSNSAADFEKINLELKTSPLKQLKNLNYVSKERLVLNIINYLEVVDEDFIDSTFWKKNKNLLLVFYIHNSLKNFLDYEIKIVDEWKFSNIDLEIIKNDWSFIIEKIKSGKAHELSEGDTLYLGACTKGGKGGNLRQQPNSPELAKQRAFSLKQGYVNHIIAALSKNDTSYGKLIPDLEMVKISSLEQIVLNKFKPFYEKDIDTIINILNLKINKKAKNFYANLSKAILGISLNEEIEEFKKADITIKTVRLKENELPKEDISFPAFKYKEIINESWENSKIKDILEQKFLFIFFQYQGEKLILKRICFWNMPYNDILEVKKVWHVTKTIISNGNIVKEIKKDKNNKTRRFTNFPSKKDNKISHVRPHAINANDTFILPIKDILTKSSSYTKHCFWLNNTYIRDSIYKNSLV